VSEPTVAPYGAWSSPITPAMLAAASMRLGQVAVADGLVYWTETRPDEAGRTALVRGDAFGEPQDVVPATFGVRTKVHEYGGGAFVVRGDTVFFSNFADQRLYRHTPGAGEPVPITPETGGAHRYADGRLTADGRWWIGVRERHEGPNVPADVHNELVALPTDGAAEPRILAGGRDFYADPRISPDGRRVSFLAWDLPWMPWDGTELFVADLGEGPTLGEPRLVAGRDGEESIWQPSWGPDGDLYWASDRSGWWNLERDHGGERQILHPAEGEFGAPLWNLGSSTFAFLGDGRIVCLRTAGGVDHLGILDPETGELTDMDLPQTAIPRPTVAAEGTAVAFIGASAATAPQVVLLDLTTRAVEVLRESSRLDVDASVLSTPEPIAFPTEGDRDAYAYFYPPANGAFLAPKGERPPLIVMSHGGPTGQADPSLDAETQFWTSRGFAVVDVNYGGSSGFGRAYRQRLNGMWGVVDTDDCINAARHLAREGRVDGDRLLIRGGSAGGYTTLCALTFHDDFAAGASYFGIADLVPFAAGGTHKFECMYEHTLVGPWPEAEALYRERSPINSIELLSTPTLVLQGAEDEIVPPAQAELIVGALRDKGLPHAYLLFEGEQHGFRMAGSIRRSAEAELSFYAQILGFEPGDPIPRLAIENLPG